MKVLKTNNPWFPSIFDDILTENRLDLPNYENFSIPALNIKENLSNFVIDLAAPGLKKENFVIEIEQNTLRVSAKILGKEGEINTEEDTNFTRREFNYSNFERSFTIPETIKVQSVNATYKNGILEITLPKKEEHKEIKRMVEIS